MKKNKVKTQDILSKERSILFTMTRPFLSPAILLPTFQSHLQTHFSLVLPIIEELYHNQARVYAVGGAIRDTVLKKDFSDLDLEVHGLSLEELQNILQKFGEISEVGKTFGVLKLHVLPEIDWALPRSDSKGRKPRVSIQPNLSLKEALARRDLTINSIAIELEPKNYTLHDPYRGLEDLYHGILRATNPLSFTEDPLRFFRVMRYAAILKMNPAQELVHLCTSMNLEHIAQERITSEYKKMLLHAKSPSLGFQWLHHTKKMLSVLPSFARSFHFSQAARALDSYAQDVDIEDRSFSEILAILCRSFLVPVCTLKEIRDLFSSASYKNIIVPLSELIGEEAKRLAKPIFALASASSILSKTLDHSSFFYKMLAHLLQKENTSITHLIWVTSSFLPDKEKDKANIWRNEASLYGVLEKAEPCILSGNDLTDEIKPSPLLGKILELAYLYQIQHECRDISELKAYAIQEYHHLLQQS